MYLELIKEHYGETIKTQGPDSQWNNLGRQSESRPYNSNWGFSNFGDTIGDNNKGGMEVSQHTIELMK